MRAVDVKVDTSGLEAYAKLRLGGLNAKSRRALRGAVNATARKSRSQLKKRAVKTFAAPGSEIRKTVDKTPIKKAAGRNLSAVIKIYGLKLGLGDFNVKPKKLAVYGANNPPRYQAQVVKGSKWHTIKKDGNKGFLQLVSAGAKSVPVFMARKGKERYDTTGIRSLSVPEMITNKRVYGAEEKWIQQTLFDEVYTRVEKELKRK